MQGRAVVPRKLLEAALHPYPTLGVGIKDKIKLGLISILAAFTVPFLLAGERRYSRVVEIVNKSAPKGIAIRTGYGLFYCRDYLDFAELGPSYETELRPHLTCNGVFVDVGAEAGRYTVMIARMGWRVIAVEPSSENFCALKRNIRLNDLHNIDTINLACWNESGLRVQLFLSPSRADFSTTIPRRTYEPVTTITLDDILSKLEVRISDVNLVKVDAEVAETRIFEGGKQLFTNGHPRVLFEAFPKNRDAAIRALGSFGYRTFNQVSEINYVAEK